MNEFGEYKLIAFEPENAFETTGLKFIKFLKCAGRDDLVWSRTDVQLPELPSNTVILASRHEGDSLDDPKEFPIHVYICKLKNQPEDLSDEVSPNDISIVFWGLLLKADDPRDDLQSIFG